MNHSTFQPEDEIRHLVSRLELDPSLNVCVVSHKSLYDEGCVRFFTWLATGVLRDVSQAPPVWTYRTKEDEEKSPRRFPRSLDSLELSDVHMGDEGFRALVDWLTSLNEPLFPLTKLSLRTNEIRGDAQLATKLVSGSPQLTSLILSGNPLSSEFKQALFSLLPELPWLGTLHLTMTGLNLTDAQALAAYITRGCKLIELHASSNNMGYKGVRAIVRAMEHCWTMDKMEVYANDVQHTEESSDSLEEWEINSPVRGWQTLQDRMKHMLTRNVFLKRQTAREAVELLKYSRLMLRPLPSPKTEQSCSGCECVPATTDKSDLIPPSSSPFHALPVEIQLSILSQLAPTLSTQQRLRVFAYATDLSTLPNLRLCLPSADSSEAQCLPDPSSLTFPTRMPGRKTGSLVRNGMTTNVHVCGNGNCMGNNSVLCKRKTDRQKWLEQVGCDSYDPGPRN